MRYPSDKGLPLPTNQRFVHILESLEGKKFLDGARIIFVEIPEDFVFEDRGTLDSEGVIKEEETESKIWTLESAYQEAQRIFGKYSDNKRFIDELYEAGILTQEEYVEINGEGVWNLEENIGYVRRLLYDKLSGNSE